MKRKLTILIDMDDVLENLLHCWIAALNKEHGTSVSEEDITDWYLGGFFPSLTSDQLYMPLFDPYFWDDLTPMQNAPEVVKKLIDDGHTVRIVTASHYWTLEPKLNRFLKMYPYLTWKDIIIAHDKSCIRGDVLIDDGFHNLVNFQGVKLLFDRPHNRCCDTALFDDMGRVKTWDEIYHVITVLSGGRK